MEKEEKTEVSQEETTEEVVESTESEESSPEPKAEEASVANVDEESEPVEEAEEETEEAKGEESSLTEKKEEVPFNENPKFQERLQEIETKYGKKSQMWDTLAKISNSDPEFQLELTRRLEAAGELPKGTYEMAKEKSKTSTQQEKQPDEIRQKVEELPEVQYARGLMYQDLQKKQAEQARIEGVLQSFEKKHSDIANSEKPEVIRSRIGTLAEGYREEGMDYEESLEAAYSVLFKREDMIAEAREKGEIEGQIKSEIKSVASTPNTSQGASKTSLRKLSREEEEARNVLNMTKEEYINYKDSDGFVE